MRNRALFTGFVLMLVAMAESRAEALTITPSFALVATSNTNGGGQGLYDPKWYVPSAVDPFVPTSTPYTPVPGLGSTPLYKKNVGSSDEGQYAANYETTFANSSTDPSDATITWNGPNTIAQCITCYLVVKDGGQSPARYLFDISSWNGKETIQLTGFWPNQGAISHISIWGTLGPVSTPEPASLAFVALGLAIVAIAVSRNQL